MKKIICFNVFYLLSIFYAKAQMVSGEAVFALKNATNVKTKLDSLSKKNKKEVFILKQLLRNTSGIEFTLKFNTNDALFFVKEKMDNESEKTTFSNLLNKSISNTKCYIDLKTKKRIVQKQINGDLYLIQSSLDSIKWKITKEKKVINNIVCFKAITYEKRYNISGSVSKDKITAWFAPSIPLTIGPFCYGNLPGLIIEFQKGPRVFYLKKINYFDKKIKNKKLEKGIKTTDKELSIILRKNLFGR